MPKGAKEFALFFHVRITRKSDLYNDLTRVNLSEKELDERFIAPYKEGRAIVIGGRTVPADDLERIRVSRSDATAESFFQELKAEDRASHVIFAGGPSMEWRAADLGEDITDELITGPPGSGAESEEREETRPADSSVVFVVHGRNMAKRDAMFDFLRSLQLKPFEWLEAIKATNKPAPFIGEILEAAFSNAQAVVVLMTPDDRAYLREELQGQKEPEYERNLTGQARPNVLFEAGMAMGRHDDRTVLVEIGSLRPFSDIAGRHVVHLDNSTEQRQELAAKLKLAGCPVNTDGTDWHTVGDFNLALEDEPAKPSGNAKAGEAQARTLEDQIREFIREGSDLKRECLEQSEPPPKAKIEHWRTQVKAYLQERFGGGLATEWDESGKPKRRFTGITTHRNAAGLWEAIQVRLERLEEIEKEFR